MPYAISRIAKLKQSNIGGSGMHVSRTRVTPNADPAKLSQNQTLIHNDDRDLPLSEVVHNKIYSVHQHRKIRTDAVYAVEILLTASPEYFRPDDPSQYGSYQADRLASWVAATKKWLGAEYGDRIVRAELHLDEATPHIHAYLVPVDAQGQLNCKKIFGGRAKMFAFQDSYAAATKHLGLVRGVKESLAEHTTVKEYYAIVNAASSGLETDLQVLQTKAAAYEWMQREQEQLKTRVKLLAQQRDKIAVELKDTQASISAKAKIERAMADRNPLISIAQVAIELQLDPRELDPSVGTIDLVAATRATDLGGALSWLNDRFGAAATAQLLTRTAQTISELPQHQFVPPDLVRSAWGEVRNYLTDAQSLPAKLIDRLYDEGLIYADAGGTLICVHRDFEGRVTGATAIDPQREWHQGQLVEGSSLTGGFYYFENNAQVAAERVVITDRPIEAMAYSIVNDPDCPTLYLATHDGRWIPGDKFGKMEVAIAANLELFNLPPQAQRHLPIGKNWIADLKTLTESLLDINTDFPSVVTSLHPEKSPSAMIAQIEKQQHLDRETGEQTTQQSSPQSTPRKHRTMRER